MDAGARFLAAFNEIEDHFRKVLGADEHAEFQRMAQSYAASRHLPREQRDALSAFASLRNAISHGRYYGGRPIAEPVDAVVGQIERLRDRILTPPRALSVLGTKEVRSADVADPVAAVLQHVQHPDRHRARSGGREAAGAGGRRRPARAPAGPRDRLSAQSVLGHDSRSSSSD